MFMQEMLSDSTYLLYRRYNRAVFSGRTPHSWLSAGPLLIRHRTSIRDIFVMIKWHYFWSIVAFLINYRNSIGATLPTIYLQSGKRLRPFKSISDNINDISPYQSQNETTTTTKNKPTPTARQFIRRSRGARQALNHSVHTLGVSSEPRVV